ncbi:unnamed protein product [Rhodiola kirilowii]
MSSGNRRRSTSQRDVPSSSRATANPNMDMDDYLHPGPIDPSLLTMQKELALKRFGEIRWITILSLIRH